MAKKRPPEATSGTYSAVPHRLLDSTAFMGATDRAKSLLFALIRQHNGSNNGRLQLTDKWLSEHGWPSKELNAKTRIELIERDLIIQTRRGGLNSGCNWFALTWLPISNFVGLDITANSYHPGAWAACDVPPTSRRKPPQKRVTPPDYRGSPTPTTGAVDCLATPTTGAREALLGSFTPPTTGNNVLTNTTSKKPARADKRIVGKSGRSGARKNTGSTASNPATPLPHL